MSSMLVTMEDAAGAKRLRKKQKRAARKERAQAFKCKEATSGKLCENASDGVDTQLRSLLPLLSQAASAAPADSRASAGELTKKPKQMRMEKKKRRKLCDNGSQGVLTLKKATALAEPSLLLKTASDLVTMVQKAGVVAMQSLARKLVDCGLLTLLPSLLYHPSTEVVRRGAEILGALAISSYEINCKVSGEKMLLEALTNMLSSREPEHLLVACHSVMDVAVTPFSRSALRELPGFQLQLLQLMSCLADALTGEIKITNRSTVGLHENLAIQNTNRDFRSCTNAFQKEISDPAADEMQNNSSTNILYSPSREETIELLDLTMAAVNDIFEDHSYFNSTTSHVLLSLQIFWKRLLHLRAQHEVNSFHALQFGGATEFIWAPNRRKQLARLIVKLAMLQNVAPCLQKTARSTPFREMEILVHFLQHWESSSALTTTIGSEKMVSRFFGEGICLESPPKLLKTLMDGMVGCPPSVADELDPVRLYKYMECDLGGLPAYGEDIRLVKCVDGSEVHYLHDKERGSISAEDCIHAYELGYTVVIRGLQFRFPEVAAVADGLAMELGQVTVGANLYMTPPNSQGLDTHFDDHCVFVYQLLGHKRWTVYPSEVPLPRLYNFKALSHRPNEDGASQYELKEGDVLYIPRGFPHEAHTECSEGEGTQPSQSLDDGCCCQSFRPISGSEEWSTSCQHVSDLRNDNCSNAKSQSSRWTRASLHLSFGVEVEPAFEWQGLLHIALRFWSYKSSQLPIADTTTGLNDLCEGLLHVAFRNIGNKSESFRKACVFRIPAADAGHPGSVNEEPFKRMLKEVEESANFDKIVQDYKDYHEGLSWLSWLTHLHLGFPKLNCSIEEFDRLLLKKAFADMKYNFIREASFQASIELQTSLLLKFRTSRRQIASGLLALHCSYTM